jgi:hypothetical protein
MTAQLRFSDPENAYFGPPPAPPRAPFIVTPPAPGTVNIYSGEIIN